MTATFRALTSSAFAAAALGIACSASGEPARSSIADSVGSAGSTSGRGFVGVAVGEATYGTSCGNVSGLTCSRSTTSITATAGNMITRNLGIELSAMHLGRADRAGGSVIARGINLSAVGRVPLGESFGLEGRAGTTYGVTHVNAASNSGVPTGRDRGFGLAYGVALDVDVARGLRGAVGWEQHDFHFAGQGTSTVRNITLRLGCRF
jgi:hypothetical protein